MKTHISFDACREDDGEPFKITVARNNIAVIDARRGFVGLTSGQYYWVTKEQLEKLQAELGG